MTYDCRKSRVIGIVQSKVYMRGHACVVMHSIYRQYVKNVKDRLLGAEYMGKFQPGLRFIHVISTLQKE